MRTAVTAFSFFFLSPGNSLPDSSAVEDFLFLDKKSSRRQLTSSDFGGLSAECIRRLPSNIGVVIHAAARSYWNAYAASFTSGLGETQGCTEKALNHSYEFVLPLRWTGGKLPYLGNRGPPNNRGISLSNVYMCTYRLDRSPS